MRGDRRAASVIVAIALWLSVGATAGETAGGTGDYSVIVHPSNSVGAMSRAQLSDLFLRRATRWGNGQRVLPVNLVAQSSLREAFSQTINRKSVAAERAYWQRQIFTGRGVPPVEVASEEDVLAYVAKNPGAVGYVSRGRITAEVRELEIRDAEPAASGTP